MKKLLILLLLFGCAAHAPNVPLRGSNEVRFELEHFNVRYEIVNKDDSILINGIFDFKHDKVPEGSKTAIVTFRASALDSHYSTVHTKSFSTDDPWLVYTPIILRLSVPDRDYFQYLAVDYTIDYQ